MSNPFNAFAKSLVERQRGRIRLDSNGWIHSDEGALDRFTVRQGGCFAGRRWFYKGRVLNPGISKSLGYPIVILRKSGDSKTFLVHRLVALAFLLPVPEGCEINHKNGDKSDPSLDNLEWVTHVENANHSIRTGLRKFVYTWAGELKRINP